MLTCRLSWLFSFLFYLLWGALHNFTSREFTLFPLYEEYQALLCLAQWHPVALLHLLWAEPDLLYRYFVIFPWDGGTRCSRHCDYQVSKCFTGACRRGHKNGGKEYKWLEARALNFFPWTGIECYCLLPSMASHAGEKDGPFEEVKWKDWRSPLRDREEMDKDLLKLKYLGNGIKCCGII